MNRALRIIPSMKLTAFAVAVTLISGALPIRALTAQQSPGKHVLRAGDTPGEDTIGLMDEQAVKTRLQKAGYTDIAGLARSGSDYTATASLQGKTYTVTVDGRDGEVIAKPKQ